MPYKVAAGKQRCIVSYCCITGRKEKTKVIDDNLDPVWNEVRQWE